jgi:hypothetical protein
VSMQHSTANHSTPCDAAMLCYAMLLCYAR